MVLSHEKSRRRVCRWCGMTKWRGWRMDYVWNFKEDLQLLGIDINDPKEKLLPTRICRICRMCFQSTLTTLKGSSVTAEFPWIGRPYTVMSLGLTTVDAKPEDLESLHSHEDDDNELQIPRSATWILATATHGDDQTGPGPIEPGVLNLCATTIGAGMLGLPKAFASCGVFIGVLVIITTSWATDRTLLWLVLCARESRRRSYEGNAQVYLGVTGERILNTTLLLLLVGACMAMMVITIDLSPPFLAPILPGAASPAVVAILTGITVLPFTLTKDLSILRYVSAGSLVCTLILFATLVYMILTAEAAAPTVSFWRPQSLWSVIASFPLVLSSYVGHFNIFKIDYELKHRYHADINNIIHISIWAVATPLYIASGIIGYLLYGDRVKSNLVQEWSGSSEWVLQVCLVAVILINICKFPLLIIPLRESLTERIPALKHANTAFLTASLLAFVALAALSTRSLGTVLTLVGSLAGSAVGLFLPAAMYVAYRRRAHARELLLREIEQAAMETMNDPMLEELMPPPPLSAPQEAPTVKYWTVVPSVVFLLGISEAVLGLAATVHNWGSE
ncbi:hypothetical protein FOZ60_015352 [Perkinsus olseni]|uniref:Amino acid transporter transmembrane domain-containing protein n=1 Tax=Perkinsus olseni TaxID=32597 RepID=A0A7J6P5S8_PEROL|nr:hypothetical protein FOZ60_015352 [Perkinsus olseni]